MTLAELIERLEKAEEGSRELDTLIAEDALGQIVEATTAVNDPRPDVTLCIMPLNKAGALELPRYTTSLDAALTLVPEGRQWKVGFTGTPQAWVYMGQYEAWLKKQAATPALALCIAALKARAA